MRFTQCIINMAYKCMINMLCKQSKHGHKRTMYVISLVARDVIKQCIGRENTHFENRSLCRTRVGETSDLPILKIDHCVLLYIRSTSDLPLLQPALHLFRDSGDRGMRIRNNISHQSCLPCILHLVHSCSSPLIKCSSKFKNT